jgi:mono/diheme cytochrome c family protein
MPILPKQRCSRGLSALTLLAGAVSLGCDALDEPMPPDGQRVVPTDARQAIRAESPPPPLSGGTLLVTSDGQHAVVGDEARDRLSVIDLRSERLLGEVSFAEGSQPGRVVEGRDGLVHVVLRQSGVVASVRLDDLTIVRESEACAAPRGLGYDAARDQLYVACVSGRFVTLGAGGEVLRSVQLPNDLRDVVVENGNVWVSRFRSAEVLRVDDAGTVVERLAPPSLSRSRRMPDFTTTQATFEPVVGWRLRENPQGGVVLVHQRATTEEIELQPSTSGGSAYGSGDGDCSGIQRSALTSFRAGGRVLSGPDLPVSLPVDVALGRDGLALVAGAGRADVDAPRSSFISPGGGFSGGGPVRADFGVGLTSVSVTSTAECDFGAPMLVNTPDAQRQYVVAVAAHPSSSERYVVQLREPAQVLIVSSYQEPVTIQLGGDSVADTGFDLFHRNAEAGLSCASCHPDGTDDGHVWTFEGQGPRRTQPLDVGLAGTAPFHWDGSLHAVGDLMGEVFVGRMGGVHQSPERLSALTDWLFDLEPPVAEVAADDGMVFRGRRLFESAGVGCGDCHRGETFTDNNSYDVGTGLAGEKFQVPSLRGIGTRSRLIHDGCARSLRERFGPDCGGGDRHGNVSQLSPSDLDDLVAYLETL